MCAVKLASQRGPKTLQCDPNHYNPIRRDAYLNQGADKTGKENRDEKEMAKYYTGNNLQVSIKA